MFPLFQPGEGKDRSLRLRTLASQEDNRRVQFPKATIAAKAGSTIVPNGPWPGAQFPERRSGWSLKQRTLLAPALAFRWLRLAPASFQAQHILHVVQPGFLLHHPLCRPQSAVGESFAAGGLM